MAVGAAAEAASPALNVGRRFAHIDALRAFAVLLVVVAHAGLGHIVPGGSGVTIFFTVSGFVITHLLLRERDKTGGFSVGGFYWRRAVKIFPPLAVIVIIPTLIWSFSRPIDWSAVAAQVFFVFNWQQLADSSAAILPGSGVVWSLAIEEQFYIVFAIIWLGLVRARRWRLGVAVLAGVAIVIATGTRIALAGGADASERIYFGTDTRMDGLAIGVLAALLLHWWTTRGENPTWWTRALKSDVALAAALLMYLASLAVRDDLFRDTLRFTLQSVAAAIVILYGMLPASSPIRRAFVAASVWRPTAVVGLASYSIYLVHLILDQALRGVMEGLPLIVRLPLLTAIGVGAGVAIYYLLEVPVLEWRRRFDARRAARTKGEV